MTPCENLIWALETHSSRINKEQIIEAAAEEQNQELFEGFRMALDNLYTFGIKQVPIHNGPDGKGFSWPEFKDLADQLYSRSITGHAARDAVELAMKSSKKDQWNNWYRRILIKDLRCGVSEKTVNKVLKGRFSNIQSIPVFECMLAHDGLNHENKITGKKLLEPKLDGVRVITVINAENQTVTQFTRNGKILENFNHITDAIKHNIDYFERSIVLDGEMISSSFQDLMKQVHRKENVKAQDARLMLFDILPLVEFQNGRSVMGQRRRSNLLKSMKPIFDKIGNIDIVDQLEVDLESYVGQLEYKEFNKKAVQQGFEGIMIKDINAVYECKRSHSWLKQKPFIEVSLEVVKIEEGTGRNSGRLGALVCRGHELEKHIAVNVGSGFTDDQRNEFWYNRDSLSGQIIEVRADAITMNQDGTYSLRFPRFLRFRGFSVGEKI